MKSEGTHAGSATAPHSASFSQESWSSSSPYSQSSYGNSPMNDYGHFGSYTAHGMPSEALSGLPSGLPQVHPHPSQMMGMPVAHHQLPMLNTDATWPSQLIHNQHASNYPTPISAIDHSIVSPRSEKPRIASDKQRKTLSFEKKRDMCLYHEKNPKVRQADIGNLFGVERSTVSKVLSHKDIYLKGEADKDSNGKPRSNPKNPDFDRTLSNFIKKHNERGLKMTDEQIMMQAQLFARASNNRDSVVNNLSSNWLHKFKQKYSIGTCEPLRRASEPSIHESFSMSSRFQSISPSSASVQNSPLSGSRSDDDLRARGDYNFTYRQFASQSEASLTDNSSSSFSSELISPVGPFGFSPDTQHPTGFSFGKREDILPPMEVEYASRPYLDGDLTTPRNLPSVASLPSFKQEASTVPNIATHHDLVHSENKGDNDMKTNGNRGSSAGAPSPEDVQRAATTLLSYLQSLGQSDQFEAEYTAIMKFTQNLQINPNRVSPAETVGLARIPEAEPALITAGGDIKN